MTRTTDHDRRRDQRIADDFLATHQDCRFCGHATPRDDLATYGARCRSCYDAYLAERNPAWWPNRPLQPHEREAVIRRARNAVKRIGGQARDPRQWARDLQAREEAGEPLTNAQRESWRYALRNVQPVADADGEANPDAICTRCGQSGHRASHCPWPTEASAGEHRARAHLPAAGGEALA